MARNQQPLRSLAPRPVADEPENPVITLLKRIGLTEETAKYIVEEQGIAALELFGTMSKSDVTQLCKTVRRKGETDGESNVTLTTLAEMNIQLLVTYVKFLRRTSQAANPADIDMSELKSMRSLQASEEAYKTQKEAPFPKIIASSWPKTLEALEEYLATVLGVEDIPLAYVVRENVEPMGTSAQDPTKVSFQRQMIQNAPIKTDGVWDPTFLSNNEKVYDIIASLTRDHESWTYVAKCQADRDGRRAFQALKGHYLGDNYVQSAAAAAESKINTSTYTGESRRWTFEQYATLHKEQHLILDGLSSQGYQSMDQGTRVRKLLNGISAQGLEVIKAQILSSPNDLGQNFDKCVCLFKDYLHSQAVTAPPRPVRIAAVNTGQRRLGQVDDVDDRYYTKEEYNLLTDEQRRKIAIKRKQRGHKPGAQDSYTTKTRLLATNPNSKKRRVRESPKPSRSNSPRREGTGRTSPKALIQRAVARTVAQLTVQAAEQVADEAAEQVREDDHDSLFSTDESEEAGNRDNPSLTRQKPKK